MLLIDGDLLVFKAAAYYQDKFKWDEEDEDYVVDSHVQEAWKLIKDRVVEFTETLNDSEFMVVFSDKKNFRKVVWPEYKANRDPSKKPEALGTLIGMCKDEYGCVQWKNLEADDVLGILCTRNPEWIAVTEDKDQATVPGRWWNYRHPELGVRVITEDAANMAHMTQALAGDSSDGYKGIPRVGPKKAEKILATAKEEFIHPWAAVVMAYHEKELTYDEALRNARMAYILRDGDYNQKTGAVRLWNGPGVEEEWLG